MRSIVFDLDGTLYRGTEIIPGARVFVEACQKEGIPIYFLTNNSMRTPEQNARHMLSMGYTDIRPEQFFNSAMASAMYVRENFEGNRAWYIGEAGMQQALEQNGFVITEDHPDFVFVGLDKKADYASYSRALSMLLGGARLIGTNKDRILAKPGGFEVGNGSVVALFEYATGQKSPDIAKPSGVMLDLFLKYFNLKREDVILVGDNLETDIALGFHNNVETLFVTSGVHTVQDIDRLKIIPDHRTEDLSELDPCLVAGLSTGL